MAGTTQVPQLRMPRATSQALTPTRSLATSRAATLAVTHPTLAQATRAMVVATLVATLEAGAQPAMFQAQRPTGSLVLSMGRTPTATLAQAARALAARATAATPAQVSSHAYLSCPALRCSCMVLLADEVPICSVDCSATRRRISISAIIVITRHFHCEPCSA